MTTTLLLPVVFATTRGTRFERTPVSTDETHPALMQLVEQARGGCLESFEKLVALFELRIFNYICRITRNPHDAEDLMQVTFVKAYRNIYNFQTRQSFAPWLFTIAKRTTLNHLRDRRPTEELSNDERVDHENPATSLERKDEQDSVWTVARSLSPDQYEALWLRYGEGFSIAEMARVMNTNQVRVRVLLHRARGKMAELLRQQRPDLARNFFVPSKG